MGRIVIPKPMRAAQGTYQPRYMRQRPGVRPKFGKEEFGMLMKAIDTAVAIGGQVAGAVQRSQRGEGVEAARGEADRRTAAIDAELSRQGLDPATATNAERWTARGNVMQGGVLIGPGSARSQVAAEAMAGEASPGANAFISETAATVPVAAPLQDSFSPTRGAAPIVAGPGTPAPEDVAPTADPYTRAREVADMALQQAQYAMRMKAQGINPQAYSRTLEEAAAEFDRAFNIYPHPELLHNRARVSEELGLDAEARSLFEGAAMMAQEMGTPYPALDEALSKSHAMGSPMSFQQALSTMVTQDPRFSRSNPPAREDVLQFMGDFGVARSDPQPMATATAPVGGIEDVAVGGPPPSPATDAAWSALDEYLQPGRTAAPVEVMEDVAIDVPPGPAAVPSGPTVTAPLPPMANMAAPRAPVGPPVAGVAGIQGYVELADKIRRQSAEAERLPAHLPDDLTSLMAHAAYARNRGDLARVLQAIEDSPDVQPAGLDDLISGGHVRRAQKAALALVKRSGGKGAPSTLQLAKSLADLDKVIASTTGVRGRERRSEERHGLDMVENARDVRVALATESTDVDHAAQKLRKAKADAGKAEIMLMRLARRGRGRGRPALDADIARRSSLHMAQRTDFDRREGKWSDESVKDWLGENGYDRKALDDPEDGEFVANLIETARNHVYGRVVGVPPELEIDQLGLWATERGAKRGTRIEITKAVTARRSAEKAAQEAADEAIKAANKAKETARKEGRADAKALTARGDKIFNRLATLHGKIATAREENDDVALAAAKEEAVILVERAVEMGLALGEREMVLLDSTATTEGDEDEDRR